jgi:hypothetical protein
MNIVSLAFYLVLGFFLGVLLSSLTTWLLGSELLKSTMHAFFG